MSRASERLARRLRAALAAAALALLPALHAAAAGNVALVVVNDAYRDLAGFDTGGATGTLEAALGQAGFRTVVLEDATTGGLLSALRRLSAAPDPGATAVFYYVGYARQLRERTFLIARNAQPSRPFDFVTQGVDLDSIMRAMADAGGRLQLAVIDGAYPEPRLDALEGLVPGLAPAEPSERAAIVLGAPPGQTLGGPGGAAALATAFAAAIEEPGAPLGGIVGRFAAEAETRAGRRLHVAFGTGADMPLVAARAPDPEPEPEREPEPQAGAGTDPGTGTGTGTGTWDGVVMEPAPADPAGREGGGAGFRRPPEPAAPADEAGTETAAADPAGAMTAEEYEATLDDFGRKRIQLALRALGLYQLGIDGDFGPGTRRAIETFQRLRGYDPTGRLTAAQTAVLFDIAGL